MFRTRRIFFILIFSLLLIEMLNPYSIMKTMIIDMAEVKFPEMELFDEIAPGEGVDDQYYQIIDETGEVILKTGRRVMVGDEFLAPDNNLYEVYKVDGFMAKARHKETVRLDIKMPDIGDINNISSYRNTFDSSMLGLNLSHISQTQNDTPAFLIGIYHTHNAESYIPTEGTEYIYGKGGIHKVGAAFKSALEAKGIDVIHNERLHLPHDRGAYRRSRITAREILAQRPDVVFDVHRDAAPLDAYAFEVDGVPVSRIMMVVGRANPNMAVNRKFAYDLKGYADLIYPDLVRGVFIAHGSYNQDLSPLNSLLEVGTRTSTRASAEQGITLFADIVAFYFYGPEFLDGEDKDAEDEGEEDEDEDALPPALYRDAGGVSTAVSGTVLGLLFASLLATLGFFFINNPDAGEKITKWIKESPERFRDYAKQGTVYLKEMPHNIGIAFKEFPQNFSSSLDDLKEDARKTPARINGTIETSGVFLHNQANLLPHRIKYLRSNWREGINFFKDEYKKVISRIFKQYNKN